MNVATMAMTVSVMVIVLVSRTVRLADRDRLCLLRVCAGWAVSRALMV